MDDLKVSVRQLLKTPGFTLAAIGVLALGIGLNAAMFSVVYALAFAGRPYAGRRRLVQIYSRDARTTGRLSGVLVSGVPGDRGARPSCSAACWRTTSPSSASARARSRGGRSRRSSARNYFDVLGVPLLRGRGFTAEESRPGQNIPVVVATLCATGSAPGSIRRLVGTTIRINERLFTVVGITPQGFTGTMSVFGPELFFPLGVFHSLANDFQGDTARTLSAPTRTTCSWSRA